MMKQAALWLLVVTITAITGPARAEGEWEVTPESEAALDRGLSWLARNQGPEGNWDSNDSGLVSMGALAFLSAGHLPGRGRYGQTVERALTYVIRNAKPSGLLNHADPGRDMYNHGLSTFVLGQAYGITADARLGDLLGKSLKVIAATQCADGGWDYRAHSPDRGHDLSLAVMQAKALRSAVDSGLEVPPEIIELAIKSVREHYHAKSGDQASLEQQKKEPGQFTYTRGGGGGTTAMAACGVVCLQEFGQYDDWRIAKNMDVISAAIRQVKPASAHNGQMPFDSYTLYYVGQALYQTGGDHWRQNYPLLRDHLAASQIQNINDRAQDGAWNDGHRVGGKPGQLYATSVACFVLAMPNRYLPILQEGKIDSLRTQFRSPQ